MKRMVNEDDSAYKRMDLYRVDEFKTINDSQFSFPSSLLII